MKNQKSFYTEVGRLVREERKSQKLTQDDLAAKASLTRVSISNIESGKQKVLLHTLVDIAMALEISPEKLIPEEQEKISLELLKNQSGTKEAKKIIEMFFDENNSKKE